jgi:hypothetical protein
MNKASFQWNGQLAGKDARMTVHVALGIRTARDLRFLLLEAAYTLSGGGHPGCLCLLFKCGLTKRRLAQELEQFQGVLRPEVGRRIEVHALKSPADLAHVLPLATDATSLAELQAQVGQVLLGKPKSSSREAVVGMLLHRWIHKLPPVRLPELAAMSGASLPTTYAAVKTLDPMCLARDDERGISLKDFPAQAWQHWLSACATAPSAKFIDRSGSPRSPQKLAQQLSKLGRQDLAIGGVLGAKHHFPALDMTAAPHLDIVVHGNLHTDLSFVAQLDPALVRDDAAKGQAHVIVHFLNRPNSLFETKDGFVWADVLECLVNLWDAGFIHQVEHLINHVAPVGLRQPIGD